MIFPRMGLADHCLVSPSLQSMRFDNRDYNQPGSESQRGPTARQIQKARDTFVKTSHILAKLRATLKERLNILTLSFHKETTTCARKQHENMVHDLALQLDRYFAPFLNGVLVI